MKITRLFAVLPFLVCSAGVYAQDAGEILEQTAAHYRSLDEYRFDADVSMQMQAGPRDEVMDVSVLMAARQPNDLHVELVAPNMEITIISDGDSTWMYMPTLNQYMVSEGGFDAEKARGKVPDLLGEYQRIADKVHQATLLREESLEVGGRSHPVYVLSVKYKPRQTSAGTDSTEKTLWIDKDRHVVLRDVTRAQMASSPFGGPMVVEETTMFSHVSAGGPLPDSLFAFAPPSGATRVYPEDVMNETASGGPANLSGRPATNFVLKSLEGQDVSLESFRGKVVLVNFWATWCGPCRIEMPAIQRLYQEFNDDGLEVLAVSLGEPPEDVAAYIDEYGYTFPVLVDPSAGVGVSYGAYSIPASVIIDREGTIVQHFIGAHPEEAFRTALKDVGIE